MSWKTSNIQYYYRSLVIPALYSFAITIFKDFILDHNPLHPSCLLVFGFCQAVLLYDKQYLTVQYAHETEHQVFHWLWVTFLAIAVRPSRPFNNVKIDYASPLFIKEGKRRNARYTKCYLAIFICMAVKAVHIQVVSDLSTATDQNDIANKPNFQWAILCWCIHLHAGIQVELN